MNPISNPSPVLSSLVIFSVAERRYAVLLSAVERILPASRVRPIRCGSKKVLGLVHLPDQLVPVLSLRTHLGLEPRQIEASDRLLVVRCRGRSVALIAEEIEEDLKLPRGAKARPGREVHGMGLVHLDGGLDLIADVDRLLDGKEEVQLERALRQRRRRLSGVADPRLEHHTRALSSRESCVHPMVH